MNCANISPQLGFHCTQVGDGLLYVESPLTLAFDGLHIGAFIQDIGRGLVRITDNADILFTAITHGISPNAKRAKRFGQLAGLSGITLSDGGELYTTCPAEQAGFHLARFMEAASRIGNACDDLAVTPVSKFERQVGGILSKRFKGGVRRNVLLIGASGHQLSFPFALARADSHPMVIQTIAANGGKPNWASIYGAVGKMGDLKNSGDPTRRVVILQTGDPESTQQASIALAETAAVIVFDGNEDSLEESIKAA